MDKGQVKSEEVVKVDKVSKIEIKPAYLHLEINSKDWCTQEQIQMLQKYASIEHGTTISRDIIIPDDMPLNALHYTIQKAFGWQNTHIRDFQLATRDFNSLVQDNTFLWASLVGVLFRFPYEYDEDLFWNDEELTFDTDKWLSGKYTGPYKYGGYTEEYKHAKAEIEDLLEELKGFKKEGYITNLESMTKASRDSIKLYSMFIIQSRYLLERLEVTSVLASKGQPIHTKEELATKMVKRMYEPNSRKTVPEVLPVTRKIVYSYDYGDGWTVNITRAKNFSALVRESKITAEALKQAEETVINNHKPVCVFSDGSSVMDDVGNISGFADFIETVFEGDSKAERENLLSWAIGQGWDIKEMDKPVVL